MLVATSLGMLVLLGIDPRTASALTQVWVATTGWLAVRTAFGLARVWPGVGQSPLRAT
jgi:MATE family multidrug resistance protein